MQISFLGIALAGVFSLMVLPSVWAQPADTQPASQPAGSKSIVTLADGTELEGWVTKQGDDVVILQEGGKKVTVAATDVKSISDPLTPAEDYQKRYAAIKPDDVNGMYDLADYVWEHYPDDPELLGKAKVLLDQALEKNPQFTRAILRRRQVVARLEQLSAGTADKAPPAASATPANTSFLVSDRDIYWIRLKELKKNDRVRIQYEKNAQGESALRRYIDMMRGGRDYNWDRRGKEERFLKMSRLEQVAEMLDARPNDVELQKDILIETDPQFMLTFRRRVWPLIQNNCARPNCHGGAVPRGGFKLFVTGDEEKVAYTNFVILSGLQLPGNRRLIDRQDTENSLLLQFGLDKKVAKQSMRHPPVGKADIAPIFVSKRSSRYRTVYDWIDGLEGPVAPNYHMDDYKAPYGMKIDTTGKPTMDFLGEPKKER